MSGSLSHSPGDAESADVVENEDLETTAPEARSCNEEVQLAERLAADRDLIDLVRKDGFVGTKYDELVNRILGYGVAVMNVWIRDGTAFKMAAQVTWKVEPTEREREILERDFDATNALAVDTVLDAFERFHTRAMVGGEWDPERGASLTTYFLGGVMHCFPNAFRKWRRTLPPIPEPSDHRGRIDRMSTGDLAQRAVEEWQVEQLISCLSEREARVVGMVYQGYDQKQIAEHLQTTVRAVEGTLYRVRQKLRAEGYE